MRKRREEKDCRHLPKSKYDRLPILLRSNMMLEKSEMFHYSTLLPRAPGRVLASRLLLQWHLHVVREPWIRMYRS